MILPEFVLRCVERLESAGFPCYAVGGCVRDSLLGLTPQDYDLCTAATPAQMKQLFQDFPLVTAGEKHGTVGVVTGSGVVEITTFRTEGAYRDNRHPDRVAFVDSIEADLARRDFTVNAIAYSPTRGLQDPFGGGADLKNGVLRAVGHAPTRFREDSLRILRGVRFAVRYRLQVEPETMEAMTALSSLMDNLARERVYDELCKLLPLVTADDLLRFAPIITAVIPELAPQVGFHQRTRHHAYDIYTHTAHVCAAVPPRPTLRWAALLHDVGKPACFTLDAQGSGHFKGHAQVGQEMADGILRRLKAPTAVREEAVQLIGLHMTKLPMDKKPLRRWLSHLGPALLEDLLLLQQADMGGKGVDNAEEMKQFPQIRQVLAQIQEENACLTLRDLAVSGHDLIRLGYSGPAIGNALRFLLDQVLDEKCPNEKQALLNALNKP